MKIDYFRTLESVLRTGSLAAASHEMNVTPSAVSMQMKQLEIFFGVPLFDRSGLQVRPTALAREVVNTLQPALDEVERMRTRDRVVVEGQLRVGVIDSLQPTLMPRMFSLARARYPALQLRVQRGRTSELTNEVKAGTLDAAIVAQPDEGNTQRLAWRPLFRSPLVAIAPRNSVETGLQELFTRYEWIRFDRDSITGRLAGQFIRSQGLRSYGDMELQSFQSIFAMVQAGLGVSLLTVADPMLCVGYPVRIFDLGPMAPALQFSLAMRPSNAERRTHAALQGICEEAARGRYNESATTSTPTLRSVRKSAKATGL